MEASDCFLYFLPEELREFEVCFFTSPVSGGAAVGWCWWWPFLAPGGGQRLVPVLRPLADSLAILGTADVVVEVEGERSVAQKLKLVFYSDERGKVADAMASLDGLLYFVGFSFSCSWFFFFWNRVIANFLSQNL
jgi:hypothetical protein